MNHAPTPAPAPSIAACCSRPPVRRPRVSDTRNCPWCGAVIDASALELPALRRDARAPPVVTRIRLDGTARPQGHGQAAVRQFVLPDRRRVRSGGGRESRRRRQRLLHPSRPAVERSAGQHHHHVAGRRLEAHVRGHAADHDAGAGSRAHRVFARRAGRNDRACRCSRAKLWTCASTCSCWPPTTSTTTGSRPTSGTPRESGDDNGDALSRRHVHGPFFARRKRPACCCCTPPATCSCASWRPARPFW